MDVLELQRGEEGRGQDGKEGEEKGRVDYFEAKVRTQPHWTSLYTLQKV